jgi:hypothetical protein
VLKVTLNSKACSAGLGVVGDDRIDPISDEVWREGTVKFALLQAPLDVWLLPDDDGDEALLLACSLASETVSRDGVGVHWS